MDLSKCPRSYNRRCQWYPKIYSMLLFPLYLGVIRRVCHQVFHCRASDVHPLLCMHAVGHEPLSEEGKIQLQQAKNSLSKSEFGLKVIFSSGFLSSRWQPLLTCRCKQTQCMVKTAFHPVSVVLVAWYFTRACC